LSIDKKSVLMLMNEFNQRYFRPQSEEQQSLLDRFLTLRSEYGHPSRIGILRNLAKTRKYTRSIYPPDWKVI